MNKVLAVTGIAVVAYLLLNSNKKPAHIPDSQPGGGGGVPGTGGPTGGANGGGIIGPGGIVVNPGGGIVINPAGPNATPTTEQAQDDSAIFLGNGSIMHGGLELVGISGI